MFFVYNVSSALVIFHSSTTTWQRFSYEGLRIREQVNISWSFKDNQRKPENIAWFFNDIQLRKNQISNNNMSLSKIYRYSILIYVCFESWTIYGHIHCQLNTSIIKNNCNSLVKLQKASIAQRLEHWSCKPLPGSSILTGGSPNSFLLSLYVIVHHCGMQLMRSLY